MEEKIWIVARRKAARIEGDRRTPVFVENVNGRSPSLLLFWRVDSNVQGSISARKHLLDCGATHPKRDFGEELLPTSFSGQRLLWRRDRATAQHQRRNDNKRSCFHGRR